MADLIDEPDPLSAEEATELAALNGKGLDLMAALPVHLRPIETAEDIEWRELFSPAEPPRQRSYEDPAARRKHPLSER